jgi:hypothetical protein
MGRDGALRRPRVAAPFPTPPSVIGVSHASHPVSEFVSFGCPTSGLGFRNPQYAICNLKLSEARSLAGHDGSVTRAALITNIKNRSLRVLWKLRPQKDAVETIRTSR